MSQIRRGAGWAVKYQHKGKQVWVPGGPFKTKKEAIAAETAHRQRFSSHATCTAFSKLLLKYFFMHVLNLLAFCRNRTTQIERTSP